MLLSLLLPLPPLLEDDRVKCNEGIYGNPLGVVTILRLVYNNDGDEDITDEDVGDFRKLAIDCVVDVAVAVLLLLVSSFKSGNDGYW